MNAFWRFVLALVPTRALQAGLSGREGVEIYPVAFDEITTLRVPGPAIVTVNRD